MSGLSQSHHTKDAQRKIRWALLIVAAVFVLATIPLALNPKLRLDLAYRFGTAPGKDVEQIGTSGDGQTLVVIPLESPDANGRPQYRYLAAGIFKEGEADLEFTSIASGKTITLPMDSPDFYAGSFDGRYLLVRDTDGEFRGVSVLIDLDNDSVSTLPDGQTAPDGIDGNWKRGAWEVSPGICGGNSPNLVYVECFKRPMLAAYLAGDWQLVVRKYGDADKVAYIFRGLGFRPWAGWTKDDSTLYFQNENGIWVTQITPEMLEDS